MPAGSAEEIAAAEAAFVSAQAAHQAALDSDDREGGQAGWAEWVRRQQHTSDLLDDARSAMLAAYGMPDASVNGAVSS